MHHIYHTEAIVLKGLPTGEDSKTLFLYTRELGLIRARAQGVRKLSSKLRFALQDFSHVQVDLVRGKEIWRLTTAVLIDSHAVLRKELVKEKIMGRVHSVVLRLVNGEEANEEAFSALLRMYALLFAARTPEACRPIELLSVARLLIALGYLSRETFVQPAHDEDVPHEFDDVAYQHQLIRDINQALAATQL